MCYFKEVVNGSRNIYFPYRAEKRSNICGAKVENGRQNGGIL